MKYFLTKDTSQPVKAGDHTFKFEAAVFHPSTGSWWGTLALEDPGRIAALEGIAKDRGIAEISAEDYEKYERKKKIPRREPHIKRISPAPLTSQSQPGPGAAARAEAERQAREQQQGGNGDAEPAKPLVDPVEAENTLEPKDVPAQRETLSSTGDSRPRKRKTQSRVKTTGRTTAPSSSEEESAGDSETT